ncbi:hypothetical protein NDU88_001984 [Pleurodeles waltl]|uniref:Uncharacterized protein n=1 Tax=Pleurodeles waltl TaxID=8319 RepID=A0AAV7MNA3_PLEWA|nr:hypothetical protein NDU88_001984 [Pleurodeles waltl]
MGVPLADARVQEALRLLREAGRLDLIQGELGALSRPPRWASGGVAAAVLACSEPRGAASRQLVVFKSIGRLGLVENGCTIKGTVVVVIVTEEQVQRGVGTDQECDNREGRQGRQHTRGKRE